MPLDPALLLEVIEVMESFLEKRRPPKEIRFKLDLAYEINNQSLLVVEIRPDWMKPSIIRQHPFAKATFVKATGLWKVYWMRADLKWHAYPPRPTVKSIAQFARLVDKDANHCFFG